MTEGLTTEQEWALKELKLRLQAEVLSVRRETELDWAGVLDEVEQRLRKQPIRGLDLVSLQAGDVGSSYCLKVNLTVDNSFDLGEIPPRKLKG